jgi:hypothetical protein
MTNKAKITFPKLSEFTPTQAYYAIELFLVGIDSDALKNPCPETIENPKKMVIRELKGKEPELAEIVKALNIIYRGVDGKGKSRGLNAEELKVLDNAEKTINDHIEYDRQYAQDYAIKLKNTILIAAKPEIPLRSTGMSRGKS